MNLKDLSDEELYQLRVDVAIERERRQALESIPAQIKDLTDKFISIGGDPADLEKE